MSKDIYRKKFLYSSSDSSDDSSEIVNPLFKKMSLKTKRIGISPPKEGLSSNLDSPDAFVLRDISIPTRDIYGKHDMEPCQEEAIKATELREKRLSAGYLSIQCSSTNLEGNVGYDPAMISKWIDETNRHAHIKRNERGLMECSSTCDDNDSYSFPDGTQETRFYNIKTGKLEPATKNSPNAQWGFVKRTEDSINRQDYHQGKLPIMLVRFEGPYYPQSRKSRLKNFCRGKRKINKPVTSIPSSDSAAR